MTIQVLLTIIGILYFLGAMVTATLLVTMVWKGVKE